MNRAEKRRQQKLAKKAAGRSPASRPVVRHPSLGIALAHHKAGRLSDAGTLYQQILQDDPNQPDALQLLGMLACQTGKNSQAVDLLTKALAIRPDYAEAHCNLGNAYKALGRFDQAVASYKAAITFKPELAEAHSNLGNVLRDLGVIDEAVASCKRAVALKPDFAEAHSNLGNALRDLNMPEQAIASYSKALAINPGFAEAHNNLGNAHKDLGQLDEAEASYSRALVLNPGYLEAHCNRGHVLNDLGRLAEAVISYDRALAINPDHAETHYGKGNALKELWQLDEAVASYNKALAINPAYPEAHCNLGTTLQELGKTEEAIASCNRALALKPDYAQANWNLGLSLLMSGDFPRGMEGYDWRWKDKSFGMPWRDWPYPVWDGSLLKGKRILVWGEQGIGTEIVFASLFTELINRGASCVFECEPRLVDLFQRSFPTAQVIARRNPQIVPNPEPPIDFHCPAGDLLKWLLPSFDKGPVRENYLQADPHKVARLKARYRNNREIKLVGLGWWTQHARFQKQYNIPEGFFDSLLRTPGVQFVNLQYGDHRAEIEAIEQRTGVTVLQDAEIDPLKDMDAFATQQASMDLVISIVNSTAVLAAGLGTPVWGLLPKYSEWRWGNQSDHCLWYPSMPVFRQSGRGDWSGVSEEITVAFRNWASRSDAPS